MTTGITLEIPAKAEYLSLVRAVVVSAAALDPAVEDQRLEDLRLAVSEATTKAIRSPVSYTHLTLPTTPYV